MSVATKTIDSRCRPSRVRLVLVIIVGVAVTVLYWIDHEYTAVCRDEGGVLPGIGLPRDFVISLLCIVDNCVGTIGLITYLAVITMLILGRTLFALLRAMPLIVIGVPMMAAILIGEEGPEWLALIIVWGLPVAVGVTLLHELFLYFRPPAVRE